MKRISDYTDDAAFDLLADMIEPVSRIFSDTKIKKLVEEKKTKVEIAKYILKNHKSDATEIFKAIDSETVITPVSILKGIIDILTDIEKDPAIKDFFNFAEQETEQNGISGSATVNTADGVK